MLTVGCNVLGGSPIMAGLSIASVLMVRAGCGGGGGCWKRGYVFFALMHSAVRAVRVQRACMTKTIEATIARHTHVARYLENPKALCQHRSVERASIMTAGRARA